VPPLVAAKPTPESAEPLAVTVPLTFAFTVKLLLVAEYPLHENP
jgi:hypothetical protein